jgi:hypothetical protein
MPLGQKTTLEAMKKVFFKLLTKIAFLKLEMKNLNILG